MYRQKMTHVPAKRKWDQLCTTTLPLLVEAMLTTKLKLVWISGYLDSPVVALLPVGLLCSNNIGSSI